MSSFSSPRRVNLCPMKPLATNPPNIFTSSLTDQQKKLLRLLRFVATKVPAKVPTKLYGFLSRGEDTRLQELEPAQREYFDWILETFREFEKADSGPGSVASESSNHPNLATHDHSSTNSSSGRSEQVLNSLRKLREALLHQEPSEFSTKVHLFSVRVSSAVGHYQTYIPSIQYLLSDAPSLLSPAERSEIATILALHISHRNENHCEAFRIFFQYLDSLKDARILHTLLSYTQRDYYTWMSLYNSESDHLIFAVMSMGLSRMMRHMVACLGGAYYTYDLEDLKKFLPKSMSWEEFQERYTVPWDVEDQTVHIRRRQLRAKSQPKVDSLEGKKDAVFRAKSMSSFAVKLGANFQKNTTNEVNHLVFLTSSAKESREVASFKREAIVETEERSNIDKTGPPETESVASAETKSETSAECKSQGSAETKSQVSAGSKEQVSEANANTGHLPVSSVSPVFEPKKDTPDELKGKTPKGSETGSLRKSMSLRLRKLRRRTAKRKKKLELDDIDETKKT